MRTRVLSTVEPRHSWRSRSTGRYRLLFVCAVAVPLLLIQSLTPPLARPVKGRPLGAIAAENLVGTDIGLCAVIQGLRAVNSGCGTVGAVECTTCSGETCWTTCTAENMWTTGGTVNGVSVGTCTSCGDLGSVHDSYRCVGGCPTCQSGTLLTAQARCAVVIPNPFGPKMANCAQ